MTTEHSDVLGDHIDRAERWLANGYGVKLDKDERSAIIRVLFDRAWQCKSEMDAAALLASVKGAM